MAGYLSTQFQDYGGGELANALDFVGWNQKRKSNEQMLKNQQLNEQMALEDLMTTQQKRPLELERSRLDNAGLEALLPEKQAKGQQAKRDWEVEQGIPVEQRQQAMRMKLAREMTEDDLKTTQAAIERGMVHESPAVRQQAAQLRMLMADMVKLREGFQSKEDVASIAATAKETAAKEATIRAKATIEARAKAVRDQAARVPRGYQEAATRYRILAEEADDPETKLKYLELATEFEAAAQTQAKASKAGQTTITPEGGLGVVEATPQLGPRNPKPMSYASPDNVKEAVKAGKLKREDAIKILREQFGMK